jgi:hypothetical protein
VVVWDEIGAGGIAAALEGAKLGLEGISVGAEVIEDVVVAGGRPECGTPTDGIAELLGIKPAV